MQDSNYIYYIRDWLLSEPRLAELFNLDTRDFAPFFPAQQFPESEFPYVRYTASQSIGGNVPWWHTGEAFLSLWFEDIDNAQEAANIIVDMCSYADESAGELERWLLQNRASYPDGIPYHYHTIETPTVGEVETTQERGGAHAMGIILRVQFSPKVVRDRYSVNS